MIEAIKKPQGPFYPFLMMRRYVWLALRLNRVLKNVMSAGKTR
jgi:hypothetical protein